MGAEELTLNIAVNLGRVARWVADGNTTRVLPFLKETANYIHQLEKAEKNPRFDKTFKLFKENFQNLKGRNPDQDWAEEALTWANILTHRAKLA